MKLFRHGHVEGVLHDYFNGPREIEIRADF